MESHAHTHHNSEESSECPACGFVDNGRFCSNCGGVIKDYRINFMYWVTQILEWEDRVTHTTIQLLTKPAVFLKEYMGGNRAKTYIPFKYLFFAFGLFCLMNELFGIQELYSETLENWILQSSPSESEIMFQHMVNVFGKFFILLFIPYYLLLSKLLHPNVKYNLAERATAITYMLGMLMMVQTGLALITALIHPFYFIKPYLVIGVEFYMVFILAYKFYHEKLIHALWKSVVTLLIILFSMSYTLKFMDVIIEWWYA